MRKVIIEVPDGFFTCKLDVVLNGKLTNFNFPKFEIHTEFPVVDDCCISPGIVLPDDLKL